MADDGASKPIRKVDDATYGTPPRHPVRRQLFRLKRWVLLDANRNTVAGAMLATTFAVIVLVGSYGPVPVRSFLVEGVSPGTILVELLKAIVSVVVIVLSINQLVLSPGLGPVGEQRERYEQSIDLRQEVEDHTGTRVSPESPALFLAVILDAIAEQATRIEETASDVGDPTFRARTNEFTTDVVGEAGEVSPLVASGRFGEFEVISAVLRFAISEKVRSLRDLRRVHEGALPDPVAEACDEMNDLLELFTIAREYLKTVYIREEYISLSEGLLYTGLPSILLTYLAAQLYMPTVFPGHVLGIEKQLLFVGGAVTIALTPFVLLVSYVFRLAAMSRSTLFVGPFDARRSETDHEEAHGHGR